MPEKSSKYDDISIKSVVSPYNNRSSDNNSSILSIKSHQNYKRKSDIYGKLPKGSPSVS